MQRPAGAAERIHAYKYRVEMYLQASTAAELFPFDQLESSEELHFQVDHSRGVVKVEPNDGAAFTEYLTRCESLPPDPIL